MSEHWYLATFAPAPVLLHALRRRRSLVLALLALPAIEEHRRRESDIDPLRWAGLALADDAAYGAGVAWGTIRTRTLRPLIPVIAARGPRSRSVASPQPPLDLLRLEELPHAPLAVLSAGSSRLGTPR